MDRVNRLACDRRDNAIKKFNLPQYCRNRNESQKIHLVEDYLELNSVQSYLKHDLTFNSNLIEEGISIYEIQELVLLNLLSKLKVAFNNLYFRLITQSDKYIRNVISLEINFYNILSLPRAPPIL